VEGRDTNLAPEVMDIFPNAAVETEVGDVPLGWQPSRLDDEFAVTMGQSPPGETYNEKGDGLPFYQGRTDFGFRFPKRRVYCTAPTRLAHPGDTLVSVRAPVGDVNMATEVCAIGRGVAAVRHRSGARSFTYLSMAALDHIFGLYEAEGTVFGAINKQAFHAITVVRPDERVVQEFERLVEPIEDRIIGSERQQATLVALRDALLPKLVSGELRVPDAERIAVEVGA
jgi:type I restriction enzyme S subunit